MKPGGVWRFTMHGPDGAAYENSIVYQEISPVERLVYLHGSDNDPGQFHTTVTFVERGQETELTMRAVFRSAEEFDKVRGYAVQGANSTLGRLAEYLREQGASHE